MIRMTMMMIIIIHQMHRCQAKECTTWTRFLKSENAFSNPKLSTLAVMKKHSQMNGYLAFWLQLDIGLVLWRRETSFALLPELVASWDFSNRFSTSLLLAETSAFPGLTLFIQSETSSDDACRAVSPLVHVHHQNELRYHIKPNTNKNKVYIVPKEISHLNSKRLLSNTYLGSILSFFDVFASKNGSQRRSITALKFTNIPELALESGSTCNQASVI